MAPAPRALLLLTALIAVAPAAAAQTNSFGSLQCQGGDATLSPGESVTFSPRNNPDMAYFNAGNDPLFVNVSVSGAGGLDVDIPLKDFLLENKEDVFLGEGVQWPTFNYPDQEDGDNVDYITVVPVEMTVTAPDDASMLAQETFELTVTAMAYTEDSGSGQERIRQARECGYTVTVPAASEASDEQQEDETQQSSSETGGTDEASGGGGGGGLGDLVPGAGSEEDGSGDGTAPGDGDRTVGGDTTVDDETGTEAGDGTQADTDTEQSGDTPTGLVTGDTAGGSSGVGTLLILIVVGALGGYLVYRYRR